VELCVFRGSVVRSCFVAIVVGCSSATATNEPPTRSLLFIGNSLTYTNDLPGMLANLAIATGDSVLVAMAAGPNLALIDHTNGATPMPSPRSTAADGALSCCSRAPPRPASVETR
jgi:hypothetical protein